MALTIIDCGVSRGYSSRDHEIVDAYAKDSIGRSARSMKQARLIVYRAAKPGNPNGSPVWVRCRTQQGDMVDA